LLQALKRKDWDIKVGTITFVQDGIQLFGNSLWFADWFVVIATVIKMISPTRSFFRRKRNAERLREQLQLV